MRIALGVAAAFFLAVVGGAGASADERSSDQRLLVLREGVFFAGSVLMDERGHVTSALDISTGLNGGVAIDRTGTKLAYVQAAAFDLPPDIPERFRRRFASPPQSTLQFGTFLRDVQVSSAASFAISSAGHQIEAKPYRPAWSPSGRAIAFAQARRGHVHLFVASLDGARPRQITRSPGRDLDPVWSPDGRQIVFERHVTGASDLYAVRSDGSDLRRITFLPGRAEWPDFSPDGRSVVFSSDVSGRFQLYVLAASETTPRLVTHDFGNDRRPSWSPDGRWIAFSSDRDGDDDVFLVSIDGKHERKLTHNATEDLVQDWQPLRDAAAPRVRALPSSSRPGRTAYIQYLVRDKSTRVLVNGTADFRVATTSDGEEIVEASLPPRIVRPGGGRHVIRFPIGELREYELSQDPTAKVPSRFRFCLNAVDPWGNVSSQSCARFQFR